MKHSFGKDEIGPAVLIELLRLLSAGTVRVDEALLDRAILSILVGAPPSAANVLALFMEMQLPTIVRMQVLVLMTKAALELWQFRPGPEIEHFRINSGETNPKIKYKTPRKLELQRQGRHTQVNAFGAVAVQYFNIAAGVVRVQLSLWMKVSCSLRCVAVFHTTLRIGKEIEWVNRLRWGMWSC